MSHIATVFDPRGIGDCEAMFTTLEAAFEPEPGVRTIKQVADCIAAINFLKPASCALVQPYFEGEDSLLIDGTFYDEKPLEEIVRILFSGEPRELDSLNGQFNAVILRKAKNEITIVTDRLGFRPIYHALAGQRHIVSSEIKGIRAIANSSFDISPVGLLELFAFGHNVDDRTLFNGISVLPPGSIITINPGGVCKVRYHEYRYTATSESRSPREWGEAISDCLKSVIPKYLRDTARTGMFLSGGLDSRIVAGAVGHTGTSTHAYTFGDPTSRDARFAQSIASRMGFPHDILVYPSDYLSKAIRDVVSRTECSAPFYHATSVIFHDFIARESDSILVGFCGDALSGAHLKRRMLTASKELSITEQLFQRALCANMTDLTQLFQAEFFGRYWPDTLDTFHASVSAIDETYDADIADVWDMQNRQRRFTFSSPKVDRHRFEIVAPLLDNKFVDLMTSLPVDARWKQSAYRHAIVDGFPRLRAVPWTKTGRPVPSSQAEFWSEEGRRVGSKAIQLVLRHLGLRKNPLLDQYRSIAEDMRHDERLFSDYLLRYLTDGSLPSEIFDRNGISQLADRHMRGDDISHLLGMTMTVAVYLES